MFATFSGRRAVNSTRRKINIVLSGLRGEAKTSEVTDMRKESVQLKGMLAEQCSRTALLKKRDWGWGERYVRYSVCTKYEIIRSVEDSVLGISRTLQQLGTPKPTFYNWFDRYLTGGLDALANKKSCPISVWNKVPKEHRQQLCDLAL